MGGRRICLKYIQTETEPYQARSACEAHGGKLPLPKNALESDFVFAHAKAWNAFDTRNKVKKLFLFKLKFKRSCVQNNI